MVWKFIENMQFTWFNKILFLKVKIEEVLNLVCVTSVCRIGTVAARSQKQANILQQEFKKTLYELEDILLYLIESLGLLKTLFHELQSRVQLWTTEN